MKTANKSWRCATRNALFVLGLFFFFSCAAGKTIIDEQSRSEPPKVVVDANRIYSTKEVQVQPAFPYRTSNFIDYVKNNMYDIVTNPGGLRIVLRFVVERDGSLTNIQVIDYYSDPKVVARAIDVLNRSPKWRPGIVNGETVRTAEVYYISW